MAYKILSRISHHRAETMSRASNLAVSVRQAVLAATRWLPGVRGTTKPLHPGTTRYCGIYSPHSDLPATWTIGSMTCDHGQWSR